MLRVEITLLGPPGARVGDRVLRVVGRQRALLAALALQAPLPVGVDRLGEVLWPGRRPQDPANALHQRVSALRKVLDPAGGGVLGATGGGYALRVDASAVDARRFESQVGGGRRLLRDGSAAAAREQLAAALDLWRGEPLEGFADEVWAAGEAQRLRELRLAATEDLAEAGLRIGTATDVTAELEALLAANPMRERLAALLMRALYREGRHADALAVHDRTRRTLAEELGVDAGPVLTEVYQQVLLHDPALLDPRRHGSDRHDTGLRDGSPGNLPHEVEHLVGRDATVRAVVERLAQARLLTLTGPGGVGKTTVALAAARTVPAPRGGTWWVDLAGATSAAAVVGAVADVLDVRGSGIGAAVDAAALVAALARRELLLVLDNCEHVRADAGDVVSLLLASAPAVRVLVTSRTPLGLAGEHRWPVPPLDVPAVAPVRLPGEVSEVLAAPAVELLVTRARQRDPDFSVTQDTAPAVAELVRRLDGIPLAVELAAARLAVLSVPELLTGLRDALDLPVPLSRGPSPRHRTMRSALEWSWGLLEEEQRTAWSVLSVPAGSFDGELAADLLGAAGTSAPPLQVLSELVEASLLVPERHGGRTRFRQLETVRAYGRDRLDELPHAGAVRERYAALVEDALRRCGGGEDPQVFDVDVVAMTELLDEAREVMACALRAGEHVTARRVAGRLGWCWFLTGRAAEGLDWLDRAVASPVGVGPPDPAASLWALGLRATGVAHDRVVGAAPLPAPRTAVESVLASVFGALVSAHRGELVDAVRCLQAARSPARGCGGWPLGLVLLMTAQLSRLSGEPVDRAEVEEALGLVTRAGADWARVYALDLLVELLLEDGAADAARALATDGLALARRQRLPELEGRMLTQLGAALHALGDVEAGRRHLDLALRHTAAAGNPVALGFVHLVAASLARSRGDDAGTTVAARAALDAFGDAPAGRHGAELARAALAELDPHEDSTAPPTSAHAASPPTSSHRGWEPSDGPRAAPSVGQGPPVGV